MKLRAFTCVFLGVLLDTLPGRADVVPPHEKFDFKTHLYFKHMIGEWTLEAETRDHFGKLEKSTPTSKTKAAEDGTLVTEGSFVSPGSTLHYQWTFTRTEDGHLEATVQFETQYPAPQLYSVTTAPDGSWMEMTREMKNHQTMVIRDAFKKDDHDTREITRTVTDTDGTVVSSTTAVSKRVKKD